MLRMADLSHRLTQQGQAAVMPSPPPCRSPSAPAAVNSSPPPSQGPSAPAALHYSTSSSPVMHPKHRGRHGSVQLGQQPPPPPQWPADLAHIPDRHPRVQLVTVPMTHSHSWTSNTAGTSSSFVQQPERQHAWNGDVSSPHIKQASGFGHMRGVARLRVRDENDGVLLRDGASEAMRGRARGRSIRQSSNNSAAAQWHVGRNDMRKHSAGPQSGHQVRGEAVRPHEGWLRDDGDTVAQRDGAWFWDDSGVARRGRGVLRADEAPVGGVLWQGQMVPGHGHRGLYSQELGVWEGNRIRHLAEGQRHKARSGGAASVVATSATNDIFRLPMPTMQDSSTETLCLLLLFVSITQANNPCGHGVCMPAGIPSVQGHQRSLETVRTCAQFASVSCSACDPWNCPTDPEW
jgi:hypothetical protein